MEIKCIIATYDQINNIFNENFFKCCEAQKLDWMLNFQWKLENKFCNRLYECARHGAVWVCTKLSKKVLFSKWHFAIDTLLHRNAPPCVAHSYQSQDLFFSFHLRFYIQSSFCASHGKLAAATNYLKKKKLDIIIVQSIVDLPIYQI